MAVYERWLQGQVSDPSAEDQLPVEQLLIGFLNALLEEQEG